MLYNNELKNMIFWGGTGQAIALEEFINKIGYQLVAVFDNNSELSSPFNDVPLYHGENEFKKWSESIDTSQYSFLVAIGGWNGFIRLQIQQLLESYGLNAAIAIHPSAYVSRNAEIGRGCQILCNSFIGARVKLGSQVIVNSSSSIDHECTISDGVHIAPGAVMAGCISVGVGSFIGAGATILPNIKIGSNVIIGAGTLITKSIPDDVVVFGNPGRIIRENKK